MEQNLLKDLNPQQQKAVAHIDGPMIILAGAGSGKTRVLTYKVIYLLQKMNIRPERILMVTFTNKSAAEMKSRIAKFLPHSAKPHIATFHALCAKILRIEGKHIGLSPQFVIYDSQDQIEAIKEAMKQTNISIKDFKPHAIHATISQAKNELLTPEELHGLSRGRYQDAAAVIYAVYQKILQESDALDFDDLIFLTVQLLKTHPDILQKYQDLFQYILIDEYQDTNKAQYVLTKLLAQKWRNVCVVGDFSQSIYSWRGADFRNLSKFKIDFSETVTFELSQNYRSTQKILDAASSVIKNNTTHPVLSLWTENPDGEDLSIYEARNEQDEANFIISFIKGYDEERLHDIAILYRTNAQSRVIEEALLHFGIPYNLVGGTRFYERKEIKDVLSYLRVIANPKDAISLRRIEKLGKTRLAKFFAYVDTIHNGIITNPPESLSEDTIPNLTIKTIDLLDATLQKTGYLDLYDEHDEEDRERLENIKELRSVAIAFPDVGQFLENVTLVEQESLPTQAGEERKNAITLMTLHAAKGLEFPIVFMIGMEEGLFPHSRAFMDKNELEEERRLAYVGMTRAKKKLFLVYAKRRLFFGQRNTNVISRFILELPEQVLEKNIKGKSFYKTEEDDFPDYL